MKWHLSSALLCGALVAVLAGCGLIADKNRWPVAKVDDEIITRGELFDIIYDMPDAERPLIRTKNDLRRVLDQIIDERIKKPLGEKLAAEGKIDIPREVARETYFQMSGDRAEELRTIWNMDLSGGEAVEQELAKYGMSIQAVQIQKDFIEQETDLMLEKLLGNSAVEYLAAQEYRAGRLEVDQDDLLLEYEVQKPNLVRLEQLEFLAISLPDIPGAREEAAMVRKRIEEGESFDDVFDEYYNKGEQYVMQSTIENNPEKERYRGFWAQLSGAQPGEIHGPVYLPPSQLYKEGAGGQPEAQVVPPHWLVLRVINQEPETTLTLEEATPQLLPPLLVARMMERLREEHGVEIYEDKLPDPAGFKDEYGESILDL